MNFDIVMPLQRLIKLHIVFTTAKCNLELLYTSLTYKALLITCKYVLAGILPWRKPRGRVP